MLKNIKRMTNYGVFDSYIKPLDFKDFSDRNVIYGWNYSGKTTISRLFGMLEHKKLHDHFPTAKFDIMDYGGMTITEETVFDCNKVIRVFNGDFIEKNLKWDGQSFNPILLLGNDSIEAEKKLGFYQKLIKRCNESAARKLNILADLDAKVAENKTREAKRIKHDLNLVDTFTATHLTTLLISQEYEDAAWTLNAEQFASDQKLAATLEKDKSAPVSKIVTILMATNLYQQASALLHQTPEYSEVIEYLKENPLISKWVEEGIHLHEGKTNCEFCGNIIAMARLTKLYSHFSHDVVSHKNKLHDLIKQATAAKLASIDIRLNEFNAQFRDQLKPILSQLKATQNAYNEWIVDLIKLLNTKLGSQFISLTSPSDPIRLQEAIDDVVRKLNTVIQENNQLSENFTEEKANAIFRLKNHYVEQFRITYKIKEREKEKRDLEAQEKRYEAAIAQADMKVKQLQAFVNQAQKGREEVNSLISKLLGSQNIQISVTKTGEDERFKLMRQGNPAMNLSEGEKTAIAFAFFMTKLQEIENLKDVIVYIDDPISSLDSNHIFQVFSLIHNKFFFQRDENGVCKTICKQLFISTHNFEFFSLLRKLPGKEKNKGYYFTKKLSESSSTFIDMPATIFKYSSEYHYLFSIIHCYRENANKAEIELLLALPNAVRRFLELYTFAKIPLSIDSTVDQRAEILFGSDRSRRIIKLLHHFSHLNNIERMATNTDLIADIETGVNEIMKYIETEDKIHYDALMKSVK